MELFEEAKSLEVKSPERAVNSYSSLIQKYRAAMYSHACHSLENAPDASVAQILKAANAKDVIYDRISVKSPNRIFVPLNAAGGIQHIFYIKEDRVWLLDPSRLLLLCRDAMMVKCGLFRLWLDGGDDKAKKQLKIPGQV